MTVIMHKTLLCWIYLLYHTNTVLSATSLTAKYTNGQSLTNPDNIEENSEITLECNFDEHDNSITRLVYLGTGDASDFVYQVLCQQNSPASNLLVPNPEVIDGTKANYFVNKTVTCDSKSLTATFRLEKDMPSTFTCDAHYVTDSAEYHEFILRSHKKPTEPSVTRQTGNTPTEGQQVTYQCESSGRPAPKLRLSYSGNSVAIDETTHLPAIDTITDDGPETTTKLTWTTVAKKDMNGEQLVCEVYGHPSPVSRSGTVTMTVFYGPENVPDTSLTWNLLEDASTYTIPSTFDANGDLDYEWYNGTAAIGDILSTSQTYTLMKAEYAHITKDSQESQMFICVGINRQNNNVRAEQKFNLSFILQEITTTPLPTTPSSAAPEVITKNPGNTGSKTAGLSLEWYYILIIIVGALALIAIVAALALFCRRRQGTPEKKKKAAARKDSNGYVNAGDNVGSQNTNPDIMRNNYRAGDVGTPPLNNANPDYRYSQHVEDYAEAIDDKPRSRKPIAYSMDELNLDAYPEQSPYIEGGPPAYHTHDPYMNNRDYMSTPVASQSSYNANYGAPC